MPAEIDLEGRLAAYCAAERPRVDLPDRLADVRRDAEKIWKRDWLHWFTDHGAGTHSVRIVKLLGQILVHVQESDARLTLHELYVLLAACYLHDIGMQDFRHAGRPVEHFTSKTFELVRREHPGRGAELIVSRVLQRTDSEFDITLARDVYLEPIALVSKGHGTAFFEEAVENLTEHPASPGGRKLRGGALAALLLMADELDLHEERARWPKEIDRSPVAELHHHLNQYVARVEVRDGHTPKEREATVVFQFPEDSDAYRTMIERYVLEKLLVQSRRTNPVLVRAFAGELSWAPTIQARTTIRPGPILRSLPGASLDVLDRDLRRRALFERDGVVARLEALLDKPEEGEKRVEPGLVVLEHRDDGSDGGMIVAWLLAAARVANVPIAHIDFVYSIAHDQMSVAVSIAAQLGVGPILGAPASELQVHVAESYAPAKTPPLVVLQNLHAADKTVRTWIEEELVRRETTGELYTSLIAISAEPLGWAGADVFSLGRLSTADVSTHLSRQLGYEGAEADGYAREISAWSQNGDAIVIASGLDARYTNLVREGAA